MKNKPLHISPEKRQFGLKIACKTKGCDTWVTDVCPLSGLSLAQCPDPHHFFKSVVYQIGTNKRYTQNYKETDLKTVLPKAALFYEQVKNGKQEENKLEKPVASIPSPTPLLTESLAEYMAYLRGSENVPEHKRRKRHATYCRYVERTFLEFLACQNDPKRMEKLRVDELDQGMVGKFYKHINEYSPVTFNMKIGTWRTYYNHLQKQGSVKVNPFYGVLRKPETHNVKVLREEEFAALMAAYENPEFGKCKVGNSNKDFYRPWCVAAIKIMIGSGRRVEEAIMAKWQDIKIDSAGEMSSLTVTDFKVSRQQNRLDNPKKINVPLTAELKEILMDCGYADFKNSDRYIIGNDEVMDRKTMKKFLSRSFSQFWSKTEYSKTKNATLKICRKTYLSALSGAIGISNARVVSQHSNTKILQDFYVSTEVLNQTAKNFSVYPKQEERQAELNKLRHSHNDISLEK